MRRALAWGGGRLAGSHLFWIGLVQLLPVVALAACWLLEHDVMRTWVPDSPERWLRLASIALVFALHAVVLVLLYLESRPGHAGPPAASGIPPPG